MSKFILYKVLENPAVIIYIVNELTHFSMEMKCKIHQKPPRDELLGREIKQNKYSSTATAFVVYLENTLNDNI